MQIGQILTVKLTQNSIYKNYQWFPKDKEVKAEIIKIYKNGVVKVVFDFMQNKGKGSTQGRKGTNVEPKDATFE